MKKLLWIGLCLLPCQTLSAAPGDCDTLTDPQAAQSCRQQALASAESDFKAFYHDLMDNLDEAQQFALAQEQQAWQTRRALQAEEWRYQALKQRLAALQNRTPALAPTEGEDSPPPEEPETGDVPAKDSESETSTPQESTAGADAWKIQVGSFRARKSAESEQQRLAAQGIDASVEQAGTWYVVRLNESYADSATAEQQRQAFRDKTKREASLVKYKAAPGTSAAPADAQTVLGLLFAGRDGENPVPLQWLYPLAVRDGEGKYQAPSDAAALLKRFGTYTIFDRGAVAGEFVLDSAKIAEICANLAAGQGHSALSEEYLMLPDEGDADAGLREGALLALNREASVPAPQPQAAPLDSHHLALTVEQENALLETIKQSLQTQAEKQLKDAAFVQPLALNIHALNVYDLDGDGGVEYFSVVTAPLEPQSEEGQAVASLFIWAKLAKNTVTPLFSLFAGPIPDAPAEPAYRLLDLLDLDGDHNLEMVLQVREGTQYRFEIYSYQQARFIPVFSGSPLGCGS